MNIKKVKNVLRILIKMSDDELRVLCRSLEIIVNSRIDKEGVSRHNIDAEDTGWRKAAFAVMFEAQFNPKKDENMRKYFPTAYARFLKILEENS